MALHFDVTVDEVGFDASGQRKNLCALCALCGERACPICLHGTLGYDPAVWLLAVLQDVVTLTGGGTVEGAIVYKTRGLEVGERFVAWKKIARIRDEIDPITDEERGRLDEEERRLMETLAVDGRDAKALEPMLAVVGRYQPLTDLLPPFEGRWHALPDTTKHHQKKVWAMYAIDFMKVDAKGRYTNEKGAEVADYLGWNEPVYAAAGGEVITVLDGFDDNAANELGDYDKANLITIRHEGGEHTSYGHLRKGSAAVKVGDTVKAGQIIARVGNSGASAVPHLHFTLMRARERAWISLPFVFAGCTLARIGKTDVEIALERARVQEDWTLECPAP